MKKLFFLLLITFFSVSAFSQKKFIGFDSALTTALPFYSDEKIQEYNKNVSDSPNRIVIGLEAAIKFNILTQLKLFLASSVQSDFNWNADEYSNHIDYDFSFGVKIYPNLYGFNFSIAYLIGQRADFINNSINKKEKKRFFLHGEMDLNFLSATIFTTILNLTVFHHLVFTTNLFRVETKITTIISDFLSVWHINSYKNEK